jgi:hypothetical protein
MHESIKGLLSVPRKRSSGAPYPGRFSCHKVQWTVSGHDILATFTITARELADAAETGLIWTDQDVQRGIKPGLPLRGAREIPLSKGYPDASVYIFDANKANDIAEKLLVGRRVFLNPLVWNLRPGKFEAYWNEETSELYIYSGRVYLPDSHHRHQGILKAVRTCEEEPLSYPKFTPEMQFKVELYFLSKEDEGNYFFEKNQRTKPTEKSKAYDLTTQDDLSLLAKRVIEHSKALRGNVNRVTDRLAESNPQVVTLSTLRQMMELLAPNDALDEAQVEGLARVAATFYDLLAETRPELGQVERPERQAIRRRSLVDSAVMMFGYAYMMIDFNRTIAEEGFDSALKYWTEKLRRLTVPYKYGGWQGDLFDRDNPLWRDLGVLKPSKDSGRLTLSNTGASRSQCGRALRQLMALDSTPTDIRFLTKR